MIVGDVKAGRMELLIISGSTDTGLDRAIEAFKDSTLWRSTQVDRVSGLLQGPVYSLNGLVTYVLYPHNGTPEFDSERVWLSQKSLLLQELAELQTNPEDFLHVVAVEYGDDDPSAVLL
jgi:hypothetical protein